MMIQNRLNTVAIYILCGCVLLPSLAHAARLKILVVMSYEEDNPWCMEIKEGIDSVFAEMGALTYFYMDTKTNLEEGEQKAREAYALFQRLTPDGVIAADDNAQRLFVVPYLKNKTDVPVIFCGVNAEPQQYGYPASNVSGILERGHIRESIAFAKQLIPSIRSVAFVARDSPSGEAILKQAEIDVDTYPVQHTTFLLVKEEEELLSLGKKFEQQVDAIYADGLQGLQNREGESLTYKALLHRLTSAYGKAILGANAYHVRQGALCAVIKTGQEQGTTAASMLLEAMQGKSVSEIPITRNYQGKRLINVTSMKKLQIRPRPIVLLGTELLMTEE